ncbi:MAG: HAMP domain-containing protein [Kofleriaceae bacterium]|nr:HAMP domain-containing protein [Kofleriaceae bacterium]
MRSLRARFVVASLVILVATLVTGLWGAIMFVRLGNVVDRTLADRQSMIDLTARMTTALEREDDALLVAVAGDARRARSELSSERRTFDEAFDKFSSLAPADERAIASELHSDVTTYREHGDALLAAMSGVTAQTARDRYHAEVNPALRRAVAAAGSLRERSFQSMKDAGVAARDEASRGTRIVAIVSLVALGIAMSVALLLARSVLRPIRALTSSVEAMRRGDFGTRVARGAPDEIGKLTDGFNRMAESLAAFQSSNLGEVIRAKETLEATIGALPDPVIVIDPAGLVASMNPLAREVLGKTNSGDVLVEEGQSYSRLPKSAADQIGAALDGTAPRRPDLADAFVVENGERRTFLPTAVPIPFADGPAGAVATLHDVTEFVRVDTLRSELIAVASHELKTPLTTLRLNLLLLGEEARRLSPRHAEILAMAVQGCEELSRTIERLLDLTRIEAGRLHLAMERVELTRVVDEVVTALQLRAADSELSIDVIRNATDAYVRGDPMRLGVVVSNLMTNAIKYTPSGGRITIALSRAGGNVDLVVSDTGPGVPADLRERVFEKFFRVAHVRPGDGNEPAGAGIGLYVCRQIVEAHGGTIRCEDVAAGARFIVSLPEDAAAEPDDVVRADRRA